MAIESLPGGGVVFTGKEDTNKFRLAVLRSGLKAEISAEAKGLKGFKLMRGPSIYTRIKREFGFKGSREKVLEQLERYMREKGCSV